ncbi:MAG: nucleotidyltransferase family protein [Pseudomonadota bacterium]
MAAGQGRRFGGDKLVAPLGRSTVGLTAANHLRDALANVLVVVRSLTDNNAAMFAAEGFEVIGCERAVEGMGCSLACGVRASCGAEGWLIALADMPFLSPLTIAAVAQAIDDPRGIAVARYASRLGHPVGFGSAYQAELEACGGDRGARDLFAKHAGQVTHVDVEDEGVVRDIDRREDLTGGVGLSN